MTKFVKEEMEDGANRMRNWLRHNTRMPSWLLMKATDGKEYELNHRQYAGLFESQNVFFKTHGRMPNYTTLNSEANNPLVLFHQPDIYTCCPTSLAMCSELLYNTKSIQECRTTIHTNHKGTTPENLINNAGKLGMKVTRIPRTLDAVKDSIDKHRPVIAHIQTGGNTRPRCLEYINNYGHYICLYGVNGNYYKVADPTRGFKTCLSSQLNKATNHRDIGYYSVSIA